MSRHTVAVNSAAAEAQTLRQRRCDNAFVGARCPYDYGKYVLDVFFFSNNGKMKSGDVKGLGDADLLVVVCDRLLDGAPEANLLWSHTTGFTAACFVFIFANRLFS